MTAQSEQEPKPGGGGRGLRITPKKLGLIETVGEGGGIFGKKDHVEPY